MNEDFSEQQLRCKDCDATVLTTEQTVPKGWQWIDICEGEDVANGWRYPECVEGWRIIVYEVPHDEFGLN
jgi:hypothetical protein